MVALAGTVNSNWDQYGPVDGYYYQSLSSTNTYQPTGVKGGSVVEPQWGGSAPSGYMGAQAVLYNSSWQQIYQSNWVYNQGVSYGISQYTQYTTTPGTYFTQGYSAAYNGNGYNVYAPGVSPNISYP